MNLYLIKYPGEDLYNKYCEAVVCANSEDEARMIHPGSKNYRTHSKWWDDENDYSNWCHPNDVLVSFVGVACEKYKSKCVIVSDFIYE